MRKSRLTVLAAMMIAACSWGGISFAQDKVELRLRLEKGQIFEQGVIAELKTSETIFKRSRIDSTFTTRFSFQTEVIDVEPDGTLKLKSTYKTISFNATSNIPGSLANIDDTAPHTLPTTLKGQSFIYTVTNRGLIENIEGIENVVQRIIPSSFIFEQKPDLIAANLKSYVEMLSRQNMRFITLPFLPVNTSDTWTSNSTSNQLVSRRNGIATMSARSSPVTYAWPLPLDFPGGTNNITVNLSGFDNTIMRVDETTGWANQYEIHQRFSGKKTLRLINEMIPDAERQTQIVSWPLYIKNTIRAWTITPPR